jgi:hypothetical protein
MEDRSFIGFWSKEPKEDQAEKSDAKKTRGKKDDVMDD